MSLFRSKFVWVCALLCVVAIALSGIVVYQSFRQPQEPIKVYKVTKPKPRVAYPDKSSDKSPDVPSATNDGTDGVETILVESPDVNVSTVEKYGGSEPLQDLDDIDNTLLTTEDTAADWEQSEDLLQIRDELINEEITALIRDMRNTYPILRLSETEIAEMLKTDSGHFEIRRQAREIHSVMASKLAEALMLYTVEEREKYYEETRRLLLQSLPPDLVNQMLNQTRDEIESRMR